MVAPRPSTPFRLPLPSGGSRNQSIAFRLPAGFRLEEAALRIHYYNYERPGQREPRSITLIVCEGETEEAYFEAARVHFNLTTAEVVVADNTKGSAPISVVECAEERAAEQGGYDAIFCVFDRDGHESFDRARAKIRGLASRARNQPRPNSDGPSNVA